MQTLITASWETKISDVSVRTTNPSMTSAFCFFGSHILVVPLPPWKHQNIDKNNENKKSLRSYVASEGMSGTARNPAMGKSVCLHDSPRPPLWLWQKPLYFTRAEQTRFKLWRPTMESKHSAVGLRRIPPTVQGADAGQRWFLCNVRKLLPPLKVCLFLQQQTKHHFLQENYSGTTRTLKPYSKSKMINLFPVEKN